MAQMTPYWQDICQASHRLKLPREGNILITGATGLIGGCLIDLLMQHCSCQIYALGRNAQRARQRFANYWNNTNFHFVQYDVCQPLSLNVDFQYIIHAASNASPNYFHLSPVEVMKANLNGLISLIDYGRNHGLQRMVYVSSGEVYGEGDGKVFAESNMGYIDILSPRACYPSAKRAAETLCASYNAEYDTHITIARPCHTYGPFFTENDNRVYAQFVRNVLSGEDIILKSKGEQYRSWIYVVDCAVAILLLLTEGNSGTAYNIANTESNITIRELAEKVAAIAHRRVVLDIGNTSEPPAITRAVFSIEKIEELGWHPLFNIDEGLRHTIASMC